MTELRFTLLQDGQARPKTLSVDRLVIAGWTGRDKAAVDKHIRELEAIGVKAPASTPVYYPVSASRLTFAETLQVTGADSSGEVEFVVIADGDDLYLGVGSDHTDRTVETYDITVSKQMCDKPIAPELWALQEVLPHWDRLILRSWAVEKGDRALYQEGAVSNMLPPLDLLRGSGLQGAPGWAALYGGTLPAIGGIRPADVFEFELEDPVLGRRIAHRYVTRPLHA